LSPARRIRRVLGAGGTREGATDAKNAKERVGGRRVGSCSPRPDSSGSAMSSAARALSPALRIRMALGSGGKRQGAKPAKNAEEKIGGGTGRESRPRPEWAAAARKA